MANSREISFSSKKGGMMGVSEERGQPSEQDVGGGEGQLVPVVEGMPVQIPRVNMGLGQVGDAIGGSRAVVGGGQGMGGRPGMGGGPDMGGGPAGMGGGGARGLRLTLHSCCLPQTQTLCR